MFIFPSAEDEEETIEAQEAVEGDGNHDEELDDLTKEGNFNAHILFNFFLFLTMLVGTWTFWFIILDKTCNK